MANAVKCNDPRPSSAAARLKLLICVVALGGLATAVPPPAQIVAELTGSPAHPIGGAPALAAVQSIVLTTAGLIVWLLFGWAGLVLVVGLVARLPGFVGRRARGLLGRIAPAAVGRVVAAAVGVSIIAGTSACAVPVGAASPAGVDPSTASTTVAATADPAAPSGSTSDSRPSIVIDWPDVAPPASPPNASPPPPTTTAAAPAPAPSTPSAPSTSWAPAAPTAPPAALPAPPAVSAAPPAVSAAPPAATNAPTPSTPSTPAEGDHPVDPADKSPADQASADQAPGEPPDPPAPAAPPPGSTTPSPLIVAPGDTLWQIAQSWIGAGATDADVDNAWRAWYFTNQAVIGDDPDLIVPGQSLAAPALDAEVRS